MSESVGNIALDLEVNQSGFNSQISSIGRNAESMLGGTFLKLGGTIGAAFAVDKLIGFGKSSVELASNLNEVQNVVDTTFGSMKDQINDFSKTTITTLGMSELSAKRYASTMGAMLKSSGISGQPLADMSKKIVGLTGDMASFYNLQQDDAFQKIRAGISGETEPLKQLGVNMSVANLQAFALKEGIKGTYQNMDQAHQSLLRYNYLLSVTQDAQGDFTKTAHSWANEVRVMGEQWNVFKTTMGQGFINMLTPVLTGLNVLISKLQVAAQYFKAFTEMVFGVQTAAASTSGTDAQTAASNALGNSLAKTNAEATKSVSGFDKLNVIGQTKGATAGSGAVTGATDAPPIATPDTSALATSLAPLKSALDDILKPLKAIDFTPLLTSLGNLKKAMEPFGQTVFEGLHWAYLNVFVPLAGWVIGKALPAFLDVLSGAFKVLNPLLETFKPFGLFLFNEFLKPIAEWTGGIIVQALKDLAKALGDVGDWIKNNEQLIRDITLVVAGFFAAWTLIEVMAFIQLSGGLADAFLAVSIAISAGTDSLIGHTIALAADKLETMALTAMYAGDFVVGIGKATAAMLANAAQTVILKVMYAVDFVKALASTVVGLIAQAAQFVINTAAMIEQSVAQIALTVATVAWEAACTIATVATTALGIAIDFMLGPIGLVILAIAALVAGGVLLYKNWDVIKEKTTEVFGYIKDFITSNFGEVIQDIKDWIAGWVEAFNGICDFVSGVFTGNWSKAWKGVTEVFDGIFKAIVAYAKIPLDAIIDMINVVIRAIDSIPQISVPGFGSVGLPHINPIPHLANGGLVSAPTLALVGDNRGAASDPEVVSPLSKLKAMMGGGNEETAKILLMILQAIQNQSTDVYMDATKVTSALRPSLTKENNRIGKRNVTLGGNFV